jgi:Protein of unknown function (DUF1573)
MRNLVFIFFNLIVFNGWSQLAEPIQFVEKVHDFGEIVEANGLAVFDFTFTNRATRPVKILTVQPSCGCTTPDWTKQQVPVGKTGFIRASYNPKDRPGYFDKTLSITTDFDSNPIVLRVKGNVVTAKTTSTPYDLLVENGHLLFRNSSFNVGKVFINKDPMSAEFPTFNKGKDTIKVLGVVTPAHIKVMIADKIAPSSQIKIKIVYDARLKNQYGFLSDNIVLKTSDESQPDKSFSVYATVEESFSVLSPEEQAKATAFKLESYSVDIGTIKPGIIAERTISYRNSGKKPLVIRHMQSNCTCLTIKPAAKNLQPGEVAQLQFSFDPTGREGLQNKAITIYSTDPVNPVQRLMIKALIE